MVDPPSSDTPATCGEPWCPYCVPPGPGWHMTPPLLAPLAPCEVVDDLVDVDRLVAGALADHPDLVDDLGDEVADLTAYRRARVWP